MIPTSVEQTQFRQPFYELLVAWGGDLALSGGVIGCTATASSAAAGHAASSVNNGDRTLLNSNWWESTNAYGKAFSPSVDGYIFRDTFANLSAWTAEYTVGASVGTHTSVANSPFLDMTLSSTVINTLSELFRRCTTSLPFNSASRTFAFTIKAPTTRHHVASGTDKDNVSVILCPTIVTATSPGAEANILRFWMELRENNIDFGAYKRIAGVSTAFFTTITDTTKVRHLRVTIDATNITVWEAKEGVLFSGAHGLSMGSWSACYIYAYHATYNTELANGSVGDLFVEGGSSQVFGSLAAQTLVQLQASELMNADFSLIQNQYATQELVEDFERFTAGATAYDWVTGAASGNKTCTTENISGYSRGLRLYNDADQYTWTQLLTRWGSDFEASWNIYLPVYTGMTENFESYSIGDSMTTHGWVNYNHDGSSQFFNVVAGKYGSCSSGVGVWSAWRYEAGYWWQNWADYTVDFDVKATAGGRFGCVVRHTSGGGYVVQGLPGVANELTLRSCNANDPLAAQTNLTAANCPAQVNHVTINVTGTRIRVWIDAALLIDYTDASNLHPTGSFTVISYTSGWTLDNLAITMAMSVAQFNQVIRCDTSFNQCYVLKHSPNTGQFFLCRDMTAGSGQTTTLVTTAFNYDLYGPVRKHNVRVVAKQAVIQVWIDGTQVANYTDATPRLGGFFGLQLKSGGGAGWGYIDNLVIKPLACTLPEYWENQNGFYGHALPVRYDQIVLYSELGQNRTTAGANNWFWQDRSGAWAVGVFDRDHRGGYLQSNCNATGVAQTGDTSIQTFDLPFYVLTAGTYYINVHDVVSSDGGQYQVLVDAVQIGGDIDQYNASAAMRWVRPSTPSVSLTAGNHTLTIRKLGTKNGSSTNYYVRMDEIILTQASAAISGNPQTRSQYPTQNYVGWVLDSNLVQLTATEAQMQTGIQPGIKQEIKFPRNQNVTAVFRVSSPNSGIKVKIGDSVSGIEQENMLNTGDTIFTFTLNRNFLEGAQGNVYLYISALPNGLEKAQLNIHKVDVWADTACNDRVKFMEAPYTAGAPTVGGTLQYKKSNLLLEPEVFDNSQWGTSGSVTLTANSDLNPLGNGTNAYQAVIASGAYLFQPVDVTFAWRNFTFSVWAKASVSTNVYIGVLDSLTAPQAGQLIQKTLGTSWTRLFISVPYTALVNDTIGEKLYAYIGTNGLGLFSNLGTATVKLFGAQLVENGSSDLIEYYRSMESIQIGTAMNGSKIITATGNVNYQYDTSVALTGKVWWGTLWVNLTAPLARSFNFDGANEYLDMTNNAVFDVAGTSATFCYWIKSNDIVSLKIPVCRGAWTGTGFYVQLLNGNVEIIQGSAVVMRTNGGLAGTQGVWTHWAFKKTGGGVWQCFKNGVEMAYLVQNAGDPTTSTNKLYIGCYNDLGYKVNGIMRNAMWFTRALTNAEIASLANFSYYNLPANLAGWWRLDENTGTTVTDSSGNSRNGSIVGYQAGFFSTDIPAIADVTGYAYLTVGADDNSVYTLRKIAITNGQVKYRLRYPFPTSARTKVMVSITTAALGSYAALPGLCVDIAKTALVTETQSDQVEIWEGSQNLLLRSAEFSNASWSKDAGAAVTADQWPNPVDFGQTADLITASIAGHSVYQSQSIVAPASNTFTFSVWMRADTPINVNLEISAVGSVNQSPAITVGKQWARYSYTFTFVGSAQASCWGAIRLATTGSIYAWGAQFEQKPYMTDYIATTSASLSRTANTVSMATPTALNGTANPFAVSLRCQLLADDFSAARNHTLFAIGNGGTPQKVTVYVASGNFNLYVRDQSGNEYTQTLPVPVGMTLLKEFLFTLWRSGGDWGMIVQDSRGSQATAMLRTTNTAATVLQTIYLGGNTSGAEIGNLRVDDFFVWNRKLTDLEYAAYVAQDVDFDYRSSNLPQLYANAINGAVATYAAGGTATVSMHVKNIMPLPVKLSFWKGDQLECQESDYGVWGGTTWAYNYEWLLLTFNKAATFNRIKLYEYPNADSSLVAPYTSGKGGIKEWYLEYWDATAGVYVPFYRHGGSIDDLEVIDLKQLIANSGFEDSVSGWLPTNPFVTLSQYSGYGVHSGAKSLKVSIAYNTQAATNGIKVPFTFVPGVTYTITAWVAWGTSQPGGTFRMEIIDGVSNPVSATVSPAQQYTWQKLTITYTTDSQAKKNGGWIRIVGYGFPTPPGLAPFVFLVDDVTVTSTAPSVTSTKLRLVMLATQATNDLVIPRVQDTQKIVGLQMFNFTDESQYVKDDDIQITIKKTADTNQIAPSYFQVKLSNITKRFSPKNFQSAIYGYTQPDGRGFVRPGSLVEISGGYIQADGTIFKDRCLKGIIGQEQNPAANTGIELQSTGEEVLLVGGDDMMQLARTVIGESNVLQNQPLEKILQYVGQLAGFGVQDMQLDTSGTVIPFAWVGGGSTALDIINEILEASNGTFFAYPGLKKTLYYYDGVKFKSWLQTTKTDFDAGTLSNVEDATEPGNVKLNLNTTALIMSAGGWSEANHMASTYLPNLLALWLKTPTSDVTFSVPNYHFNGNSEWTFQLTGLMTATAYANRNQDLGLIHYQGQRQSYFGIRTHEAGDNPPQSIVEFANCYFDAKNPQLTLSIVDEAGTVLKSTAVRLYNSGEDSPYCGILPGSGTITNKTIYIMRRRVYTVNGSVVPIYGAVTNVSGPHVIGGTPSGIQVDTLINHGGGWSAAAEDNDWAYDEIWATDSTVTNAPGTTIPCTYYLQGTVNKHDIFTMTTYYTDTRAGYPNDKQFGGVAGRAWNDNYSSYGFRSGWNNISIDHADLLAANTGKRVYLQISIPAAAKNPYGVWIPGGTSIVRNTRSVILTPNTYYKFQVRYMLFDVRGVGIYQEQPGKLFIDAVAFGTQQFYNSPDAYTVSGAYDTGKVTPIWGSLAWNILTQLNLSRGEGYQLYSQTSDDNVNWYGQGGLNGWDLIFASASDPYSVSLTARITSPQKRYIRFKAAFQTQDAYTSPIMVSASFTYTVNGFIISQALDATTGIQSWAGFAGSIITPDNTSITFATLSADDAGFTSPDPAGWVTATPGQPIASAVKRYLKWTAFLNTTDGGISPTLADVTINWIKGLAVPSDNRYYSHDTRIESFDPRAGFPSCNSCQVSANAYLLVTTTNSITANWNGSGSGTAKTLGQQIGTYSLVPVNLAAATATLEMDLNDPALTTNASGYPTYPRAIVVTIGGVNYGIIGYDAAAIKEGVQFTWAGVGGGNLVMEFHGSGTHLYLTITAAGTVSITAVSAYGYAIKKPDSFTPSQLAAVSYTDATSVALYNKTFLKQVDSRFIYSSGGAYNLAKLNVDSGKWIRDYGQLVIPIEFTVGLQSRLNVNQPNAGWQNQWCEAYEITHQFASMTTRLMVKETT